LDQCPHTQRLIFFIFYLFNTNTNHHNINNTFLKKVFFNDIILFNTKICTVHIACVIPMFLFMIYRSLFPFWKQTHTRKQNEMILAGSLASTRYDPQNPEGRLLNSSSCDLCFQLKWRCQGWKPLLKLSLPNSSIR